MTWLTCWLLVEDDSLYAVAEISTCYDGSRCLGKAVGMRRGRDVRKLPEGCYTAVALPEWEEVWRP